MRYLCTVHIHNKKLYRHVLYDDGFLFLYDYNDTKNIRYSIGYNVYYDIAKISDVMNIEYCIEIKNTKGVRRFNFEPNNVFEYAGDNNIVDISTIIKNELLKTILDTI